MLFLSVILAMSLSLHPRRAESRHLTLHTRIGSILCVSWGVFLRDEKGIR